MKPDYRAELRAAARSFDQLARTLRLIHPRGRRCRSGGDIACPLCEVIACAARHSASIREAIRRGGARGRNDQSHS